MQSIKSKTSNDDEAWKVEVQAMRNIMEGRTEMETQSADELLLELKELEDEP